MELDVVVSLKRQMDADIARYVKEQMTKFERDTRLLVRGINVEITGRFSVTVNGSGDPIVNATTEVDYESIDRA